MIRIVILLCCAVLVLGGRSPNADFVEDLLRQNGFGGRISDNIFEDAFLDVPDLVRKYKYPFEEHVVTTEDGYILGLHRIPHGRDTNNVPGDRPIVFAMHGLFQSSADYVLNGPGTSLGYILAEEGYDVWLGNARGNYYSRRHTSLNPDAPFNTSFWQFSWDEIGEKDLPAMIDYILNYTGRSALHYIGFSQGTTTFFVMSSLRPQYNQKIISMHALAPVAYMAHIKNPIFLALAPHASNIAALATSVGIGEFLPNREFYTWLGKIFCRDGAATQPICSAILFFFGGWNENQFNSTMLPVIFGHTPAGAALRQLAHYGQNIAGKEFQRYDFGVIQNLIKYGTPVPPSYDLSKIVAPVILHYSESDPLADVIDVDRLFSELGGPKARFLVPQSTFSHLDFLWGIDARGLLYERILVFLRAMS